MERLKLVEEEIVRASHSEVALVRRLAEYLHHAGGKRLRPAMVLLCAQACGYEGDDDIELGAIVEFIHTATLVHDDILDEAQLRRGHAAANQIWGNQVAVLLGDYIYIRSMAMSVGLGDLRIVQILADATSRLVEGEILDVSHTGDASMTKEMYIDILDRKTASLFAACSHAGAVLAGAPREIEEGLVSYAWNLGMAFQLVDDCLDYAADPDRLGKQTGADLREGKVTLPFIYLLERASGETRELALSCLGNADLTPESLAKVVAHMQEHGCLEDSLEEALTYSRKSQEGLTGLPPSAAKDALAELPDFVIARQH
jgi:octaprenyl-diphosphate synthase